MRCIRKYCIKKSLSADGENIHRIGWGSKGVGGKRTRRPGGAAAGVVGARLLQPDGRDVRRAGDLAVERDARGEIAVRIRGHDRRVRRALGVPRSVSARGLEPDRRPDEELVVVFRVHLDRELAAHVRVPDVRAALLVVLGQRELGQDEVGGEEVIHDGVGNEDDLVHRLRRPVPLLVRGHHRRGREDRAARLAERPEDARRGVVADGHHESDRDERLLVVGGFERLGVSCRAQHVRFSLSL